MATEQRVAKRKTHTKSRKGCFQCKQRHTKASTLPLANFSSVPERKSCGRWRPLECTWIPFVMSSTVVCCINYSLATFLQSCEAGKLTRNPSAMKVDRGVQTVSVSTSVAPGPILSMPLRHTQAPEGRLLRRQITSQVREVIALWTTSSFLFQTCGYFTTGPPEDTRHCIQRWPTGVIYGRMP